MVLDGTGLLRLVDCHCRGGPIGRSRASNKLSYSSYWSQLNVFYQQSYRLIASLGILRRLCQYLPSARRHLSNEFTNSVCEATRALLIFWALLIVGRRTDRTLSRCNAANAAPLTANEQAVVASELPLIGLRRSYVLFLLFFIGDGHGYLRCCR